MQRYKKSTELQKNIKKKTKKTYIKLFKKYNNPLP